MYVTCVVNLKDRCLYPLYQIQPEQDGDSHGITSMKMLNSFYCECSILRSSLEKRVLGTVVLVD